MSIYFKVVSVWSPLSGAWKGPPRCGEAAEQPGLAVSEPGQI